VIHQFLQYCHQWISVSISKKEIKDTPVLEQSNNFISIDAQSSMNRIASTQSSASVTPLKKFIIGRSIKKPEESFGLK
jgi:hypothetical protein